MGCGFDKMVVRGYCRLDRGIKGHGQCSPLTGPQTCVIQNNWQVLKENVANIGVATLLG